MRVGAATKTGEDVIEGLPSATRSPPARARARWVVNLPGESIGARDERDRSGVSSKPECIARKSPAHSPNRNAVGQLVSGSATGYYGRRGNEGSSSRGAGHGSDADIARVGDSHPRRRRGRRVSIARFGSTAPRRALNPDVVAFNWGPVPARQRKQ